MGLFKQIFVFGGCIFTLIFIGIFAISLYHTRAYLMYQLEAHAQDTASSLALSLTPHFVNDDPVTPRVMIDAIFDHGYYRFIRLEDTHGNTSYERSTTIRIDGIPAWFIGKLSLDSPTARAQVMAGWKQAGALLVASHPGYAYQVLWGVAADTLLWLLGCSLITSVLAFIALNQILKPLYAIERQALAISNRQYPILHELPWAPELRRIVKVMNQLSANVEKHFNEQVQFSERLYRDAYIDSLTGLGNRRFFEIRMNYLLTTPEESAEGPLFLVELADFKKFNERFGLHRGDELLREASGILGEIFNENASLARLNGAIFAIHAQTGSTDESSVLAERILTSFIQLRTKGLMNTESLVHIGITWCHAGQRFQECLFCADMALRVAKSMGPNHYHFLDMDQIPPFVMAGDESWRPRLLRHVEEGTLFLHFQPVVSGQDIQRILHYQVFLRAKDDTGSIIRAALLMPMAERLGLAPLIDREVIKLTKNYLANTNKNDVPVAINLSTSSLIDKQFIGWLEEYLKHWPKGHQIFFDVSEDAILCHIDAFHDLSRRLIPYGCKLAISHFGQRFSSLTYLIRVNVPYVKINGTYIHGIDTEQGNQYYVRALVMTAHDLGMSVIGVGVETAAEMDELRQLNIDGMLGVFIGPPAGTL